MADQETLPLSVTSAIRSLLGLKLPDRLSADLDVLTARKRKLLASPQEQAQLLEIEQRLEAQERERRALLKKPSALKPKLERAEEKLRQAEERFLAEGGKIAAEQTQRERQLQHCQAQADAHRAACREIAAGALPLTLIQPLLHYDSARQQTEVKSGYFY